MKTLTVIGIGLVILFHLFLFKEIFAPSCCKYKGAFNNCCDKNLKAFACGLFLFEFMIGFVVICIRYLP